MKNLSMLALAGLVTVGISACGSDPVAVEVNKYVELKKGDKFTYDTYDLDASQQRVAASKGVRTWTVEETGLTFEGKQGVSRILEVNYGADGTTEISKDTVYIASNGQGQIFQYDVFGNIIGRIAAAAAAANDIPKSWIQIGDVKSSGSLTWLSSGGPTVKNLTVMGLAVQMTLEMTAKHQGKKTVTVPAGTYASAFLTDHAVSVLAKDPSTNAVILNDSMMVHYNIDVNLGIVKQTLDSKTVKLMTPLGAIDQPLAGFEMELKSTTKAQQ